MAGAAIGYAGCSLLGKATAEKQDTHNVEKQDTPNPSSDLKVETPQEAQASDDHSGNCKCRPEQIPTNDENYKFWEQEDQDAKRFSEALREDARRLEPKTAHVSMAPSVRALDVVLKKLRELKKQAASFQKGMEERIEAHKRSMRRKLGRRYESETRPEMHLEDVSRELEDLLSKYGQEREERYQEEEQRRNNTGQDVF